MHKRRIVARPASTFEQHSAFGKRGGRGGSPSEFAQSGNKSKLPAHILNVHMLLSPTHGSLASLVVPDAYGGAYVCECECERMVVMVRRGPSISAMKRSPRWACAHELGLSYAGDKMGWDGDGRTDTYARADE